jgi:hypothetical protein
MVIIVRGLYLVFPHPWHVAERLAKQERPLHVALTFGGVPDLFQDLIARRSDDLLVRAGLVILVG